MAEVIDGILIREVETKNIMTKSSLPVGGYSVNPYVGCTHACKYCYASFMKRFTYPGDAGSGLGAAEYPAQERAEADQAGVYRKVLAQEGAVSPFRGPRDFGGRPLLAAAHDEDLPRVCCGAEAPGR